SNAGYETEIAPPSLRSRSSRRPDRRPRTSDARTPEAPAARRGKYRGASESVSSFSPECSADDVRLHAFGDHPPEALIALRAHDEGMRVARLPCRERRKACRGVVEDGVILNLDVDALSRRDVEKVGDRIDVSRQSRRGREGRRQHRASE